MEEKNPDMVFWLGDNPGHNLYQQKKSTQADYFRYIADLLINSKYKGKVYAVLGNHDCFPPGQFDIYNNQDTWLTQEYAEKLKYWYTDEAIKTMSKTGYFSQLHENTKLRIIGLNTQTNDFSNLYLYGNATDPLMQLDWLEKELRRSELNNESVMILGHVGPQSKSASNCKHLYNTIAWSYRYTVLMDRYSNIIKGQFFGHMHLDYFYVAKSQVDDLPILVTQQIPPLTTFILYKT